MATELGSLRRLHTPTVGDRGLRSPWADEIHAGTRRVPDNAFSRSADQGATKHRVGGTPSLPRWARLGLLLESHATCLPCLSEVGMVGASRLRLCNGHRSSSPSRRIRRTGWP